MFDQIDAYFGIFSTVMTTIYVNKMNKNKRSKPNFIKMEILKINYAQIFDAYRPLEWCASDFRCIMFWGHVSLAVPFCVERELRCRQRNHESILMLWNRSPNCDRPKCSWNWTWTGVPLGRHVVCGLHFEVFFPKCQNICMYWVREREIVFQWKGGRRRIVWIRNSFM